MGNELLERYSAEAQKAVASYKSQYDGLIERQKKYGVDIREDLDRIKAELDDRQTDINKRFQSELDTAISSGKAKALATSRISKAEAEAISGFIDDIRLTISMGGGQSAVEQLERFADSLTGPQKRHVLHTLGGDIKANGGDLGRLARTFTDEATTNAYSAIDELEKLRTEDAALEISTLKRSHKAYTKPMDTGRKPQQLKATDVTALDGDE